MDEILAAIDLHIESLEQRLSNLREARQAFCQAFDGDKSTKLSPETKTKKKTKKKPKTGGRKRSEWAKRAIELFKTDLFVDGFTPAQLIQALGYYAPSSKSVGAWLTSQINKPDGLVVKIKRGLYRPRESGTPEEKTTTAHEVD